MQKTKSKKILRLATACAGIALGIFALSACELIDISTRQVRTHIDLTQESPEGVVCLFLAELDSNNTKGAAVLMAPVSNDRPNAEQKIDSYPEMQRLGRVLKMSPITALSLDTVAADEKYKVNVEIDYFKKYEFITEKIENRWFITHYSYEPEN